MENSLHISNLSSLKLPNFSKAEFVESILWFFDRHLHFGYGARSNFDFIMSGSARADIDGAVTIYRPQDILRTVLNISSEELVPIEDELGGFNLTRLAANKIWKLSENQTEGKITLETVYTSIDRIHPSGWVQRVSRDNIYKEMGHMGNIHIPEQEPPSEIEQITNMFLMPLFGKLGFEVRPLNDDGSNVDFDSCDKEKTYRKWKIVVHLGERNIENFASIASEASRKDNLSGTAYIINYAPPEGVGLSFRLQSGLKS